MYNSLIFKKINKNISKIERKLKIEISQVIGKNILAMPLRQSEISTRLQKTIESYGLDGFG